MNRKVKIALDIVIGFVIPILILNTLSEPLGAIFTYILAALVPVAWILIDSFLITRRFNFITSYVGAFAIAQGLLAFWFVDGVQHALKDTVGSILTILVFGISILIRRPIMYYFLMQGMNPESPRQEKSLKSLLNEPKVYRSLVKSTQIILLISLLVGITNFHLNFQIVVADFGTTAFNQQVAQVNAITRIAFTLAEFLGAGIAAVLIRRAMFYYLPEEPEKEQDESDFWDLLQLRDRQKIAIDS
ncbi:MAG: VC0807 family protein [Cyanobacteria bacterium P01_H01_bin.153]